MTIDLAAILVFLALAGLFLAFTLTLGRLLRPRAPNALKNTVYECGEVPVHQAWFNFNPRFYIVALIFLVFDVEVAFTWPVAAVYRRWVAEGQGGTAFFELTLFVAILLLGLAYVWKKRDLDWTARGPS